MMRRRRRRASWDWAFATNLSWTDSPSGQSTFAAVDIVPNGRVAWLCDTRKQSHLTIKRLLLWINFYVNNSSESATNFPTLLPNVDFFIIKAKGDQANATFSYPPFSSPPVPAAVTTWDDFSERDGLDPYMWCSRVFLYSASVGGVIAPRNVVAGGTSDGIGGSVMGYNGFPIIGGSVPSFERNMNTQMVDRLWQPQLDLRVKRRI